MAEAAEAAGAEPVGGLAEEAVKLLAALAARGPVIGAPVDHLADPPDPEVRSEPRASHGAGECPHGWCPVCRGIEFVQDHPEIVEQVVASALDLARQLRTIIDLVNAPRDPR